MTIIVEDFWFEGKHYDHVEIENDINSAEDEQKIIDAIMAHLKNH